MKISNVTILSTDLANNTAKISFTISEATENVSIYLKINDEEYKEIFSNKTNEDLEYTANISRGINNLLLKATDSTTEYITEPIQVLLKEAPTIENLECSYSDSTGKYILNFAFNGDTNFKYNIYLKLDADDYIEVLSNQISGDKTIEQTSTMGNHTCILKVSDGYDDYTFSSFQFEITNRKPILSKVLVTDITNNGEAYIYYSTKDIESSTLTHKLTIGTTETVISPTQVDNFYSYRITGLSEGISNCTISISDGIDTISSDVFSIEVFSDTTDKKELLRRAKVRYDSAYQQLRDIIVSVISDLKYDYDIENALIAKAQDNYKIEYSNFNKISQQSIDTIGSNKVKVTKQELQSEINDVDSAVNSLETTMWGVFQDGILDQSERDTLSGSLDLVAKEKIDIDKDYETLYNNEDLLDPSKTKLQTNYNNFIAAHNSLVTTINNIINKEGIIDNTDKANMDTAFANWRTALGNYRTASLEAIDAIAKKKADDSADVVDKKWAEIVLDPETGIQTQVGSLQSKITGTGGIEERLQSAEQTLTKDGISNIVKDVYYTKTEVDNKVKTTVKSVNVMYYLSTSTTELIGGAWSDVAPTWEADKYMWSKTVTTLSDGTIKESSPTCIAGAKGEDGIPGTDGKTTYTWIKYADDSNGNGISNDPTGKEYIGFAYNKTTAVESNSPSDYTWSLIKGTDGVDGKDGKDGTSVTILGSYNSVGELNQAHPNNNNNGDGYIVNGDLYIWDGNSFIDVGQIKGEDGKNGADGQDGKNGLNAYVHIKYSNDGGETFTPSNGEEVGDYLGIYTDYYEADSTDVTKYTWSKIKGQDGVNGTTYYTWIKYSDNANGSNMYDTPKDSTKYIGIATNKTTKTESTDSTAYTWSKFRGEDGTDGVPGKDGVTTYTWIKYADDENGNGMSNSPIGKTYIGFAYNKTTSTESNNAYDYKWSLIKGADGINGTDGTNGIDGVDGKDGITYYIWIKYSDNANGSNMYDTPNDNTKYIGIATNQTEKAESSDYTKYVWSKFRGEDGADGADGVPGTNGKDGVTTYTWIKYADDSNGNGISNDPTGKEYIGFAYNKTTATESNVPSDYMWSLIKGTDGIDGINGVDGVTYYTWIKYSDNADGTGLYDTPNSQTKYIGIATNKTTATESTNKTDYVWSKFRGEDGTDGKGVTSIVNYYRTYTSDKGLTNASSGFSTTVPTMDSTNKYLWSYELITYTDNSSAKTSARVIGMYSTDGTNGRGISSITEYYAVGTSNTTAPTNFSTKIPTMDSINKYLWNYEVITYTDNSSKTTDKRVIGVYGETGATGTGIESITEEYYLSTSKTTQTGGSWVTTPPTWEYGKYIWIRSKIVYKDPDSTVYTTPICDSSWEAVNEIEIGGRNLVKNADVLDWTFEVLVPYEGTRTVVDDAEAKSKKHLEFKCTAAGTGFHTLLFPKSSDKIGKTYTWSFWAKCSVNKSGEVGHECGGLRTINLTTEWQKFTHTWVFTDVDYNSFIWYLNWEVDEILYVRDFKIEEGTKATDWTPAPEDVQNQIDENKNEVNTRMSKVEQTVDSWGVKITENENEIASLKLTDEQFEVKMSQNINDIASLKLTNEQFEVKIGNKVDRSNIISTINASTENITISSSKVNISGFVTFSDLSTYGTTTINGSNITTGTINGNKANITNINASNITTGTLNANYIDVINLNASNIVTGTLSGNYIRGGTIEGTLLRTTALTTYGGVSIEQNSMHIGLAAFHYADSRFKIESNANFSLSSMQDIYIMAGLNQDGTVGGKGKVHIYTDLVVEGKISASGGGVTATFG